MIFNRQFAQQCGYPATETGVKQLAERISKLVHERLGLVDYVVWRFYEGGINAQSEREHYLKREN